jgi:alanine dehydrogenase
MRIIGNADLRDLITMADAVDVLRVAYRDLARSELAYIPLISLFAPTPRPDDYFRCSAITGNSAQFKVAAIRIKSDIVSWPSGEREVKYAGEPGTFCGLILLLSTEDARPLAILQDGIIQHLRVGAAGAIGADVMARPDATWLGLLGSGGMARSFTEAIAHVRPLTRVTAYSPTRAHLTAFCSEMSERTGVEVVAAAGPEQAVRGADIVVSATSSLRPTLRADWIAPGAHVTCVQRRELQPDVYDRADHIVQLGHSSLPRDAGIPGLQRVKGGLSAYLAGRPEQQAKVPRGGDSASQSYPTIAQVIGTDWAARRLPGEVTLFLPIGTQGVQFAALGGLVLSRCEAQGRGRVLPAEWFLEDIRN